MTRAAGGGVPKRGKPLRTLLAVICGRKPCSNGSTFQGVENNRTSYFSFQENTDRPSSSQNHLEYASTGGQNRSNGGQLQQEFSDLETAGDLEVYILEDPTKKELGCKLEALHPDILFFHGERISGKEEIGGLVLRDGKISSPDSLSSIFSSKVPDLVYLETSPAGRLGEAIRSLGVPHVVHWKFAPASPLATHFRRALVAALRSLVAGAWDAFQIANASFQIHCSQSKAGSTLNGQQKLATVVPMLLGDPPPKISDEPTAETSSEEDGTKASPSGVAPVQIYDEETKLRLLVCSEASIPSTSWFGAIEEGLSALLTIEANGARLLHRVSAPPPPMAAASFTRGVVTMRCDVCTTSCARIPLLVSGAAQTCFDDQLLENSIRKNLLGRCAKIQSFVADNESKSSCLNAELRRSVSMACGAPIVELRIKAPHWAGQVLRQLSADSSYRSLAAMGIAGVEGAPVAAFQKEDTAHLSSLKRIREPDIVTLSQPGVSYGMSMPPWLVPPAASRKRIRLLPCTWHSSNDGVSEDDRKTLKVNGEASSSSRKWPESRNASEYWNPRSSMVASSSKQNVSPLLAAMKPLPRTSRRKLMPFAGAVMAAAQAGWTMKLDKPNGVERSRGRGHPRPDSVRVRMNSSMPATMTNHTAAGVTPSPFLLPMNAPPVKQHGCNRQRIEECPEEEFLQDLMQFLVSRGHGRLIPPAGPEAFPEVVLNGKRLDLYNLYREVVSRGGFHVGNGINWKGQIFAKMRNHTSVNKMTGVGNTLKKHYEVYLLEYELAHDDVDGECCILCHSGAEGDWVNCGICGEWAHFGCDRRTGLGAFKDYAKTDGLDYICPSCSAGNGKVYARRAKLKSSLPSAESLPQVLRGS